MSIEDNGGSNIDLGRSGSKSNVGKIAEDERNVEENSSTSESKKYVFFELKVSELNRVARNPVGKESSVLTDNRPGSNEKWMDKYCDDISSLPKESRKGLRYLEQTTDGLVGHGEGEFIFTSEETVNCSKNGLCTIANMAKEQGKSVRLDGMISREFCYRLVCECAKANVEICNMPDSFLRFYTQTREECELREAIKAGDNKAGELSNLLAERDFFTPPLPSSQSDYLDFDRFAKGEPEDVNGENIKQLSQSAGKNVNANDSNSSKRKSVLDKIKELTGRCSIPRIKAKFRSDAVPLQMKVSKGNDGK